MLTKVNSSVNYALRILRPVLKGDAVSVDLKQEAEDDYVYTVQGALKERVWNTDCTSVRAASLLPCVPAQVS